MEKIARFLEQRDQDNLLRKLTPFNSRQKGLLKRENKEFIDFSSNDYLGLSDHPRLKKAFNQAIDNFGVGSAASRLLSGDFKIFHELEERIAKFKGSQSALIFNSGYQANLGIISSLSSRHDVIFSDKLNHASIIDGMLLSGAKLFRFNHNDPEHLQYLLKKHRNKFRRSLIVSETVFSMDGDIAPVTDLVKLKQDYDCLLMVDEAHATGVFGETGGGILQAQKVNSGVDLIMGTFSKGLGSFGAYLGCSKKMKTFLINSCRSFIYSTALPPAIIAANLASLDVVEQEPQRRKTLLENADFFRKALKEKGLSIKGSSQIVPLILGSTKKAVSMSQELLKEGILVFPIRPPTVPKNQARLRFSLTYNHNKEILKKVINQISKILS